LDLLGAAVLFPLQAELAIAVLAHPAAGYLGEEDYLWAHPVLVYYI
jgi:hypothetical protein